MLISRLISQVVLGGDGSNNPVPFGPSNFTFSSSQQQFTYRPQNVIVFHNRIKVNLEVTGMVLVDPVTGLPRLNANDVVYMPCPPFCQRGD